MSFDTSANRVDLLKEQLGVEFELLSFGNKYLDHCLGGIHPSDLIVVTAKTGAGKTELAVQIAMSNAVNKKRVHFFALEADKNEIESRMKFKFLSQCFYLQQNRDRSIFPNYQDWLYKKQPWLDVFNDEVDAEIKLYFKTLNTYYRDTKFDIKTLEAQLHQIANQTDLVILDHLHYFDFDETNENRAMKETVKQIRDLQAHYRRPIILVAHLRKTDKRFSGLIPELEEIHGSSDIIKIATKILVASPARDIKSDQKHIMPTYFKALKNRHDTARCYYAGVVGFNLTKNKYEETYKVGELNYENTEVTLLDTIDYPHWAQRR